MTRLVELEPGLWVNPAHVTAIVRVDRLRSDGPRCKVRLTDGSAPEVAAMAADLARKIIEE